MKRAALIGAAGLLAGRTIVRQRKADFRGKVALITGGSRGLGFILARELAREGCKVAICARDKAELEVAQRDLERDSAEVFAIPCDITDRGQVERMVKEVTRRFGRVDILINNAGIIQVGPLADMTIRDFEDAMEVMFWGVVYPTMAVLPQMRERGEGWIVDITSIGGKISVPHLLPYSSAKFAAVGFSEGLRAELAGTGISVTTVAPGLMRTGSFLNAFFTGRQEGELTWFSLGSTLPFISMDAERAARQIIRAARRGDAEIVLSIPANLAARFHGLLPGTTSNILGLVNRMLPLGDGGSAAMKRGKEVDREMGSTVLDALTTLGRSAAERFHE